MAAGEFKITPRTIELTGTVYVDKGNVETTPVSTNPGPFGTITVDDWAIYDSLGPNKKIIGRAQGSHIHCESVNKYNYFDSFRMVFLEGRFKGSTLQVRGDHLHSSGQWAIVGGTGEFARAEGVIDKEVVANRGTVKAIVKADIHAFCSPMPEKR